MTIALQRNDDGSDTIFFDAVLSYSSQYNGRLTAHPIDGSNIDNDGNYIVNDHVVNDNPSFSLKGVISGADFGHGRPNIPLANKISISEFSSVTSTTDSLLSKAIGTALPFGKSAEPEITLGERVSVPLQMIKDQLISIRNNRETVTLVEFEKGLAVRRELNLVIVGLQFSEDEHTGDALHVDMKLEKANFVHLKSTTIAIDHTKTSGKVRDAAQPTTSKGPQTSTDPSNEDKTKLQEALQGIGGLFDKWSKYNKQL